MATNGDDDKKPKKEGPEFIFRRFFTDVNGVIHDARRHGKKAWKIPVRKKE